MAASAPDVSSHHDIPMHAPTESTTYAHPDTNRCPRSH
jgi:hypothetical protein